MGFDKLVVPLAGQPLLCHSLAAFQACPEVNEVVVVCGKERVGEFEALTSDFAKIRQVVPGGQERRDSVLCGMAALTASEPAWVAIHDGARPLITAAAITECYQMACLHGAATCAEPETDTIHRVDAELRPVELIPRQNVWRMQTPQIFGFSALHSLLRASGTDGIAQTDEVSAWMRSGAAVRIFETPDWNFKVTHPRDLALAEAVLRSRSL